MLTQRLEKAIVSGIETLSLTARREAPVYRALGTDDLMLPFIYVSAVLGQEPTAFSGFFSCAVTVEVHSPFAPNDATLLAHHNTRVSEVFNAIQAATFPATLSATGHGVQVSTLSNFETLPVQQSGLIIKSALAFEALCAVSPAGTPPQLLYGTVANGAVVFGNGSNTVAVDADNFKWDNNNKRLAIGPVTPSRPLEIFASGFLQLGLQSSNSAAGITFHAASGHNLEIQNVGSGFIIYNRTTNEYLLWVGTGGSVGIGNTNPQAPLQVNSTGVFPVGNIVALRQSNDPTYGFDLKMEQALVGKLEIYRVVASTPTLMMAFTRTGNIEVSSPITSTASITSSGTIHGEIVSAGTVVTSQIGGLHLRDTNSSHDLILKAGSNLTAHRTLTFITGDAVRTITLSGNPTLADWFDQSVKAASSPTFAALTISPGGLSTNGVALGEDTGIQFGSGGDITNSGGIIQVNGAFNLPASANLQQNGNAVTTDLSTLNSGVYTPTLTNVANLDGSTAYACQYMRVGSVVTVSGRLDADCTTTTNQVQLGISLPIASNFTATEQCGGVGAFGQASSSPMQIRADATNNRAEMLWLASNTTNTAIHFTFTYVIV